jgi:hypothetical protein
MICSAWKSSTRGCASSLKPRRPRGTEAMISLLIRPKQKLHPQQLRHKASWENTCECLHN